MLVMNPLRPLATLALAATVAFAALAAPPHHAATRHHAAGAKAVPTVTYAKDIALILYQNCASCHHAGQVAPFSLTSYADAKPRAAFLAAVTQSRYMPPWKADHSVAFADQRGLTDAQIALIQKWSAEGAPLGNPKELPPAPRFTSDWTLGQPDAVFQMPAPYHLAASGQDVYRCFVIPTHFAADRWVTAMQVRPGNPRVVHHTLVYLDLSGKAHELESQSHDGQPGYTSFGGVGFRAAGALGGWAPGNEPHPLPPGVGILLPKGADIVLQVHYHKDGKPETDLTRLGLYFAKGPVDKPLHIKMLAAPLWIPAGDAHYVTQSQLTVPANVTLLEIMPHMHLLGRSMTVTAQFPTGETQSLIHVPNWDFNWQTTYVYQHPIVLPRGTVVHLTASYDNSAANPRNPNNPPKLVTWGEQTTDEMCIAFLFYTVNAEHLAKK